MDINLLRIMVTVASFVTFLGILWFACSPRNKARFEKAAWLPLDEDGTPTPALPQGGGSDRG